MASLYDATAPFKQRIWASSRQASPPVQRGNVSLTNLQLQHFQDPGSCWSLGRPALPGRVVVFAQRIWRSISGAVQDVAGPSRPVAAGLILLGTRFDTPDLRSGINL